MFSRRTALGAVLALVSSVLVTSSLASAPSQAATPTVTQFTSVGFPKDVVTGPDGNLWYVAGPTIASMTPGGTSVASYPVSPSVLHSVVAGPDGNLWTVDSIAVYRVTPSGVKTTFTAGITNGANIRDITAGPDGNLWFTERGGNRIGRITPTGAVTEFAAGITSGAGPGAIVAGPDGRLWFTEHDIDKIGRITTSGTVTEVDAGVTLGTGPVGIAVGPDGNIWVTNENLNNVARIKPTGGVDGFTIPTSNTALGGIVAGADGNLWFAETSANKVGRITPTGTITEFTVGSSPEGITAGPDGNLWVAEENSSKLGRITTALDPPAYANSAKISIPGSGTSGSASPHPSTATVLVTGHQRVTGVKVRLIGLSHTAPSDIDAYLTGPGGHSVVLMSDAGGAHPPVTGVTLTFSDAVSLSLPSSGPLVSGTWKPTNVAGTTTDPTIPAGAGASLADFNGTNPNGTWSLYIDDDAGGDIGAIASGWGLDIATEPVPAPTLSTIQPPSPSNNNNPTIWGSSEAGSTVRLYSNSACTSAVLASGTAAALSAGLQIQVADNSTTTVYAEATDSHGNVSDCSTSHVTYVEDSTAPVVTIDSGPAGFTTSSLSFAFHATDAVTASPSFTCHLDSAGFTPCTSPKAYTGLTDGPHTFYVRASDAAGNTSAATTRDFTVDTSAPTVTIDSGPSGSTHDASPSFGFHSDDPTAALACQMDDDPASSCTSPKAYTGLADGVHTFHVTATDQANHSSGETRTFTVDTSPPTVTIDSGPSDVSGDHAPNFQFHADEAGVTFACHLDDEPSAACTSPKAYTTVTDAAHVFHVIATDAAGNDSADVTRSFTVVPAEDAVCNGQPVTKFGTAGNDNLVGTSGADVIAGLGGDDSISGLGGGDTICGGAGNDTLFGGSGADWLSGGDGVDTATYADHTQAVRAYLSGAAGASGSAEDGVAGARDSVQSDVENLTGGKAADVLTGSSGPNVVSGGDGNDMLRGGLGKDTLLGAGGNDKLDGGFGPDYLSGGAGRDSVTYASRTERLALSLNGRPDDGSGNDGPKGARDRIRNDVEIVYGGRGQDVLSGNNAANRLYGLGGPDKLLGYGGADLLDGGAGNDVVTGGAGVDSLYGSSGNDYLLARDGTRDHLLNGGSGADRLSADSIDPSPVSVP